MDGIGHPEDKVCLIGTCDGSDNRSPTDFGCQLAK